MKVYTCRHLSMMCLYVLNSNTFCNKHPHHDPYRTVIDCGPLPQLLIIAVVRGSSTPTPIQSVGSYSFLFLENSHLEVQNSLLTSVVKGKLTHQVGYDSG